MEYKIGDRVKGEYSDGSIMYEGEIVSITSDKKQLGILRDDGEEGTYYSENVEGCWGVRRKGDGTWGANQARGLLRKINTSTKLQDMKEKIMGKK